MLTCRRRILSGDLPGIAALNEPGVVRFSRVCPAKGCTPLCIDGFSSCILIRPSWFPSHLHPVLWSRRHDFTTWTVGVVERSRFSENVLGGSWGCGVRPSTEPRCGIRNFFRGSWFWLIRETCPRLDTRLSFARMHAVSAVPAKRGVSRRLAVDEAAAALLRDRPVTDGCSAEPGVQLGGTGNLDDVLCRWRAPGVSVRCVRRSDNGVTAGFERPECNLGIGSDSKSREEISDGGARKETSDRERRGAPWLRGGPAQR